YQPPNKTPIWKFTPRPARTAAEAAEAPLLIASASQGITLGAAPVTRSVALPERTAAKISALSAESPPQYVLHVEGIRAPADGQALFNIFLNLPEANAKTSVDAPNFVGTVTVLAKGKQQHAHQHASTNAAFDITDALGAVAKGA